MNSIAQGTPEWLEKKQYKIGGSEIFTLVEYYCQKELQQAGIDLGKEKPFQTCLELFLKIKFGLREDFISQVNSEFGLGMEEYIISRLNFENPELSFKGTKDFYFDDGLKACSPDGYIEFKNDHILRDFDDKHDLSKKIGIGTLELKTTPYEFNFEAEKGTKWQYIFQLNYNALICRHKWGMLACLTPKEKEFDNDFEKGKTLAYTDIIMDSKKKEYDLSMIHEKYNLYTYAYKVNKTIQNLCLLALDRFQKALDGFEETKKLPQISLGNKAKLLREKKLLSQIWPEKFGTLEANQDLSELITQRLTASTEKIKIESEIEELNCQIIEGLGSHIEVVSNEGIVKFDKRGFLRVSKNKN
jgi:hypothetical protein